MTFSLDLELRPGEATAIVGDCAEPILDAFFRHAVSASPPVAVCTPTDEPPIDRPEVGVISLAGMTSPEATAGLLSRLQHYEAAFFPSVQGVAIPMLPRIAAAASVGVCYFVELPVRTFDSSPGRECLDYFLPVDLRRSIWIDGRGRVFERWADT